MLLRGIDTTYHYASSLVIRRLFHLLLLNLTCLCCTHTCKVKEEFHRLNASDGSMRKPTKDKGTPREEENDNKQKKHNAKKKGRGWTVRF